jgi:hypothetical protein
MSLRCYSKEPVNRKRLLVGLYIAQKHQGTLPLIWVQVVSYFAVVFISVSCQTTFTKHHSDRTR